MALFSLISVQERVDFAKNLSIMLHSGIAINEALFSLAEQARSAHFRNIINRVRSDIENGTPLSVAFRKEVGVFGTIFVSMLKAGERSGTLQGNLQFLADWLRRSADLKREVSAAMLYPKLVFGASILLGGGLAVFILPMLVPLFNGLDVELPWITKTLLFIATFIHMYWMWTIAALFFVALFFVYLNRIPFFRYLFHGFYIHTPVIGSLLRNYELALITQLFCSLLKSGLSLNESGEIISEASNNVHYKLALAKIKLEVEKGTRLSEAMRAYPRLFPAIAINILAVGEQSGTLTDSFDYLSDYYTKEVNAQTKKLPTVIEPLLLVFIAVVVGFVALAIIMPIYELTGSISR